MRSMFISSFGFIVCVGALSATIVADAKAMAQASTGAPQQPMAHPGPSPTLGAQPSMVDDRTVILFDGHDFSHFITKDGRLSTFKVDAAKGTAIASGGDSLSDEIFGDFQLHIEFLCPVSDKEGQAKSNSGVYLHGRYEIQVLDTFGMPAADNHCGGIYKIATPLVNASRPAGEWQTYDVTFRAPRFDDSGGAGETGKVLENPRVTVLHNGIVIHNNVELPSTTAGGIDQVMVKEGPLLLQDHGDPVEFRNIWVRRL